MKMMPPDFISHENQLQHLSESSIFILHVFRTADHAGQIFIPHRQLHKRDGYVHVHGFINDPAAGVAGDQQYSTRHRLSRGTPGIDLDGFASWYWSRNKRVAEIEVGDGGVDGEAKIIGHPIQRRGMVMKHIPKGARFACSKGLTDILQSIIGKPSEIEHWNRLLSRVFLLIVLNKQEDRDVIQQLRP